MKGAGLVVAFWGSVRVVKGDAYDSLWSDWQVKHGEMTLSTVSLEERRVNFVRNVELVRAHNAAADAGEHSFWLSEDTPLADLSLAEYQATLKGRGGGVGGTSRAPSDSAPPGDRGAPPDAWDWRDTKNVVGPVKNQWMCGSCWAFSAVATMEGAWNRKTGNLSTFSEQQILDCDVGPKACDGGYMFQAIDYVHKQGGLELESSYPYIGLWSKGTCKYDADKAVGKFSGYQNVTYGDETALKVAAYEQPVVSVGIDASTALFQLYRFGVFDDRTCSNATKDILSLIHI